MNKLKKYAISITSNAKIFYCIKTYFLTVVGNLNTKSIKLGLKLIILKNQKLIYITDIPTEQISNKNKKKIKSLRGTLVALIKQLLVDVSYVIYKKLNFVGVGYKVFSTNLLEIPRILRFRLGFSHQIYFKIPTNFNFFCFKKQTKLYLYGSSCIEASQTAAKIQFCKSPEPYKGKGILYSGQKIELKEGKKHK